MHLRVAHGYPMSTKSRKTRMELTAEDTENHKADAILSSVLLRALCGDPLTAPLAPRHSPDNASVDADPLT